MRWILDQIPNDGCLLVFNVPDLMLRQAASRTGVLRVHKVSEPSRSQAARMSEPNALIDAYVIWK